MTARASIDTSELRALSVDLHDAPLRAVLKVRPPLFKAAMQIKDQLTREMRESTHFKGVAGKGAIDFDVDAAGLSAEIGPKTGGPGSLANIAYFGGSRGGGTVPDPQGALDAEAPKFEKAIADILEGLL